MKYAKTTDKSLKEKLEAIVKTIRKPTITETQKEKDQYKAKPEHTHIKTTYRRPQLNASDVMTKKLVTGNETSSLAEIAKVFIDEGISLLPITRDLKLVGIVSKTDVLNKAGINDISELNDAKIKNLSAIKISDVMKKPIYLHSSASAKDARQFMKERNISMVPIVDNERKLVGIITKTVMIKNFSTSIIGKHVETMIDDLLKSLEKVGTMPIDKIAKAFDVKTELIEEWGKILEEHDLATIVYPTFGKPYLKIIKKGT